MENVPEALLPKVAGYVVRDPVLRDHWVGGATARERRFSFGTKDGWVLTVETLALHPVDVEPAATGDRGSAPAPRCPSADRAAERWPTRTSPRIIDIPVPPIMDHDPHGCPRRSLP
jgi:hypothetical protein